jgi:hypothetical protein
MCVDGELNIGIPGGWPVVIWAQVLPRAVRLNGSVALLRKRALRP